MKSVIEYDNNGFKYAVYDKDGEMKKEGPAFDIAPSHIIEYTGWNTHPYVFSVDSNYTGNVHPKVQRH